MKDFLISVAELAYVVSALVVGAWLGYRLVELFRATA